MNSLAQVLLEELHQPFLILDFFLEFLDKFTIARLQAIELDGAVNGHLQFMLVPGFRDIPVDAAAVDRLDGGLFYPCWGVEIGKALSEVDCIVSLAESGHFSDNRFGEALRPSRRSLHDEAL